MFNFKVLILFVVVSASRFTVLSFPRVILFRFLLGGSRFFFKEKLTCYLV